MATKKRAAKKSSKKSAKKGQHFATLSKKIPKDHLAYVVGNEVRIVKRKTKRSAKRSARK